MGILFIFFILAAQLESYIDPFFIMFLCCPWPLSGLFWGLFLMGSDLSLVSMIGIILLMGLVTKNAILLIDFTKQARSRGVERNQASGSRCYQIEAHYDDYYCDDTGDGAGGHVLGAGRRMACPMAHAAIGGLDNFYPIDPLVVPVIYTFR